MTAHVLDAGEILHQAFVLAVEFETLFLGEHLKAAVLAHRFDVLELLDRLLDRLIVGQQAAEPAVVDVILSAAFGFFLDRVLRLAFGADKQDLLIRTAR